MEEDNFLGVYDDLTGTFSRDEREAQMVRRIAQLVHNHDEQAAVIERLRAENLLLQRTAEANELHIASLEIQIRRLVHPPISLTDAEPATPTRLPPTPETPRKLTRAETMVGEHLREFIQDWPEGSKRARTFVEKILNGDHNVRLSDGTPGHLFGLRPPSPMCHNCGATCIVRAKIAGDIYRWECRTCGFYGIKKF